ncbi:abl interactor 1a isoform X1 [Tachysurus ichikawai]
MSRHNSTTSSMSTVSATGTYRRAPSLSSQLPLQHTNINGAAPSAFTHNSKLGVSNSSTQKRRLSLFPSLQSR